MPSDDRGDHRTRESTRPRCRRLHGEACASDEVSEPFRLISLMIQITVILEILISCIRRLELVWFS